MSDKLRYKLVRVSSLKDGDVIAYKNHHYRVARLTKVLGACRMRTDIVTDSGRIINGYSLEYVPRIIK